MQSQHFDTIVIGSGVAGLSFLHYYADVQNDVANKKSATWAPIIPAELCQIPVWVLNSGNE